MIVMIFQAIGIFLVAYSEALGVARKFAEKHGVEAAVRFIEAYN